VPGLYYPNCLVTLSVVFDDLTSSPAAKAQQAIDVSLQPVKDALDKTLEPLLGKSAEKTSTLGSVHPIVFDVRPKSCAVHLNGYREADTFEIEFDAYTFPFSPELVRSMGVEVHLFQTDSLLGGVLNAKSEVYADDGGTGGGDVDQETLVVAGLVDEASYHAGSDGRVFRVSGRDYTCLLLDRQWDTSQRVKYKNGTRLDEVVQSLVDECDAASVLKVEVVGTAEIPNLDQPNAKEAASIAAGKYKIQGKKTKKHQAGEVLTPNVSEGKTHTNKKGAPVTQGSNYWDVIYRLCVRHGFIVFVRGTKVVISKPQVLTETTAGRVRVVAYGQDLASLDIERKMGKETTPQIEVRCWDPKSGKTLSAKFPEKPTDKITGIGTKKNETVVMNVDGVSDVGLLRKFAETAYHNLARSESTMKFATKDLKDLNGSNLLFLRPGDPVSVGFDAVSGEDFRQLGLNERLDKLLALGYDLRVAELVAGSYDTINQFRQPFYTKDVQFQWDAQQGLELSVTGVNFISVGRDDAN
jgi:hypothetical protein